MIEVDGRAGRIECEVERRLRDVAIFGRVDAQQHAIQAGQRALQADIEAPTLNSLDVLGRDENHPDLTLGCTPYGVDAGDEGLGCRLRAVIAGVRAADCALRRLADAFDDLAEPVLEYLVQVLLDDVLEGAFDGLLDRRLKLLGDRAGDSRLDLLLNRLREPASTCCAIVSVTAFSICCSTAVSTVVSTAFSTCC